MIPRQLILGVLVLFAVPACQRSVRETPSASIKNVTGNRVRIIVMDPLAAPLSCACVKGVGQRRYDRLADFLANQWNRPVDVIYDESLALAYDRVGRDVQFVIGPRSVVESDARATKTELQPLASLTDRKGSMKLSGLFVVRKSDVAQTLADLRGLKIVFGPEEHVEANLAAKMSLRKLDLMDDCYLSSSSSMEAGVFAVADGDADAAVVSDFLLPMMEACGKIEPGSLRSIGVTDFVPFVTLFSTDLASADEISALRKALPAFNADLELIDLLESQRGFVAFESPGEDEVANDATPAATTIGWTDWRGPQRVAISIHVPKTLPPEPTVNWKAQLTGPALAGIAATTDYVLVPDKNAEFSKDILRCFKAATGEVAWTIEYAADIKMEYTNAPRATPVIVDGLVYFQGAQGDLHCVELSTGRVVWKGNLVTDFDATLLTWGYSVPPLVVGDKLIVAPGAEDASIVALNRKTGATLWKTPGHAAAYAAFLLVAVNKRPQIIGYDVAGLGGWDPETGRRIWAMTPPGQADFNVGTPLLTGGDILVATENNATRRYRFSSEGLLDESPLAVNEDFAPDTCTPVIWKNRLFGTAYGELFCLDLADDLKTLWTTRDDVFHEHTNLIVGNDRVLLWTTSGDLLLIRADTREYEVVSHVRPFGKTKVESMAHPAILPGRIYLRSGQELLCLKLDES